MGRMAQNFFLPNFYTSTASGRLGAWLDHENARQFKISPSGMRGNHSTPIKQTIYEKPLLMAILMAGSSSLCFRVDELHLD